MRGAGRWTAAALLAVAAAAAAPAAAQDAGAPAPVPHEEAEGERQIYKDGMELGKKGDWEGARRKFVELAGLIEKLPGREPDTAHVVDLVGVCLNNSNRPAQALPWLERALAMRRAMAKPGGDAALSGSLHNVGATLEALGRHAESLKLREERLELERGLRAGDAPAKVSATRAVAVSLRHLGRAAEAVPLLEEALAMQRRLAAGDHPETAHTLTSLGVAHNDAGRAREAVPILEEALAMQRRLRGDAHYEVGVGIANLAGILNNLGRKTDALPMFEEALAVFGKVLPRDHPQVASTLMNMGACIDGLGRAEEALPIFERALAMNRRLLGNDHPDVARGLRHLGACLDDLGRSAEALPHREESVAFLRRLYPQGHPELAVSLRTMAATLRLLGRPAEALPLQEEALAMLRRIFAGDHHETAQALNSLAVTLDEVGRPVDSLVLREEALAMFRRIYGGDHPVIATALGNMAGALTELGRPADALPFAKDGVAMCRRLHAGDHQATAIALTALGTVHGRLGQKEDSLAALRESLEILRRVFPGDHPLVSGGLNNLSVALDQAGRAADSLPLREEAVAMWRRLFPGEAGGLAGMLVNLASTRKAMGQRREALATLREASEIALRGGWAQGHAAFVPYGRDLLEAGDASAAEEWLARGVEQVERLRGEGRGLTAEDRMRYAEAVRLWDPYPAMVRAQAALGRPGEALAFSERGRGREMLDLLAQGRIDPLAAAEERARLAGDEGRVAAIEAARKAVRAAEAGALAKEKAEERARKSAREEGGDAKEAARRVIAAAEETAAARRALQDAQGRASILVRDELPQARAATLDEMRALLGPGERLLCFDFDGADGLALLLRPAGEGPGGAAVAAFPLKDGERGLSAGRLGEMVRPALASLSAPGTADAAALAALFRALFPPALWEEVRGAKAVVCLAQGALHAVPLEALVVGEADGKPTWWLDSGPPVCYAASAGVLRWLRELRARQDGAGPATLLAAGDPLFAGAGGARPAPVPVASLRGTADLLRGLAPLPGTRREVEAARRAFEAAGGKATVLLGKDATEARLRDAAEGRPRFLHVATHGVADATGNASRSFLALTPPPEPVPGDDGALSLGDLLDRWGRALEGTRVAVLSACDTQKGGTGRFEGTVALPWGLHFAGCPTVVATLWSVSDATTPALMEAFYGRLLAGEAPLAALVAAKRELRRTRPDPFHWAPFVLLGEPR